MMTREELLGDYQVAKSETNPGWYEVTGPPFIEGEPRHLIALVDSEIGAITTVLGVEMVQAISSRAPETEAALRVKIEAFSAMLH